MRSVGSARPRLTAERVAISGVFSAPAVEPLQQLDVLPRQAELQAERDGSGRGIGGVTLGGVLAACSGGLDPVEAHGRVVEHLVSPGDASVPCELVVPQWTAFQLRST